MARPFAMVANRTQWEACELVGAHVAADGVLELVPVEVSATEPAPAAEADGALAFDRGCRVYRTTPEGGVERMLWARRRPAAAAEVVELFEGDEEGPPPPSGGFEPTGERHPPLDRPTGLAADDGDRLFVAEAGRRRVLVFDLWSRRLLRRVDLAPWTPLDLATDGHHVFVAVDGGTALLRLTARGRPTPLELPAGVTTPWRVDACRLGALALLVGAGSGSRLLLAAPRRDALGRPLPSLEVLDEVEVPGASDVAFQAPDTVVIARGPGVDFARFHITEDGLRAGRPVRGRGYQGGGIARAPDGCIAFWGALGPQCGVDAPVRYQAAGTATTFRLDSGKFRTTWGRLFLDAAVPRGATLSMRCVTSDEEERPDELDEGDPVFSPLHCRDTGREIAWTTTPADRPFRTREAPVLAGPGRYLWVTVRLEGNTRITPRVRALRAEYPDHDYLRRLPRIFSRDPDAADFLRRFLMLPAGFFRELEARADERHQLLIPETTPAELLPWLAGFVGLALDGRWPEATRRALVREAVPLFRTRGTLSSLGRFLALFVGDAVKLVENYRLRGLGGSLAGRGSQEAGTSVLGGGFRVGGAVGAAEATTASVPGEGQITGPDAWAHRFTVLITRDLTEEDLEVVHHILEIHRPAHTVYELCTVGTGMRVGRGLHVGLSSLVGPTGGFTPAQVGDVVLGREGILGTHAGIHPRTGGAR